MIQLLDINGRVVAESPANVRGETHFKLEHGASGTYILTGMGNDGKVRRKELVRVAQ